MSGLSVASLLSCSQTNPSSQENTVSLIHCFMAGAGSVITRVEVNSISVYWFELILMSHQVAHAVILDAAQILIRCTLS